MMARREVLETLAVAIAGAIWGTGGVVVTTAILVGQEGMYLPWFLAAGPLLLVSERLPVAVTGLILAPLLYAAATAALWNVGRSRRVAILATMLYALFLTGPLLGLTGHFWSHEQPFDYSQELHKTTTAARDVPEWFATMTAALVGWHAFAWWRLRRFWRAIERPPLVRWLATGLAAMMFGLVVSHWAHSIPVCQISVLLALGPTVFLEYVFPSGGLLWWYVLSASLAYGILGFLSAAAKERRSLFWPAAVGAGVFAIGTVLLFAYFEIVVNPGWMRKQLSEIGPSFSETPALFFAVTLGLVAWQVFVVSSLWRSCWQGRNS